MTRFSSVGAKTISRRRRRRRSRPGRFPGRIGGRGMGIAEGRAGLSWTGLSCDRRCRHVVMRFVTIANANRRGKPTYPSALSLYLSVYFCPYLSISCSSLAPRPSVFIALHRVVASRCFPRDYEQRRNERPVCRNALLLALFLSFLPFFFSSFCSSFFSACPAAKTALATHDRDLTVCRIGTPIVHDREGLQLLAQLHNWSTNRPPVSPSWSPRLLSFRIYLSQEARGIRCLNFFSVCKTQKFEGRLAFRTVHGDEKCATKRSKIAKPNIEKTRFSAETLIALIIAR